MYRGIDSKLLERFAAFYQNAYFFPLRSFFGIQVGWFNSATKHLHFFDWVYPKFYVCLVHEQFNKIQSPVYLVEGVWDALSLIQLGKTAFPLLGTRLPKLLVHYLRLLQCPVVIMLDGDNSGRRAADKMFNNLKLICPELSIILLPDGEDPNSLLQKGELHRWLL